MYIKDYEFRYGDLDINGNIKAGTVLDILQDIAVQHSNSVGYDSLRLAQIKIAWLLEGWRVRFDAPLNNQSSVTVKTGIMTLKACESNRGYEVWQDGERKIVATADWFTVNTEKMRITRIPAECIDAYEKVDEADNGLPFERFKPEADVETIGTRTVENRDLDTNRHMNNVKSAEIALSYLPVDFHVSELIIRYRKELKKDENFSVCQKNIDGGYHFELKNSEGDACVMVKVKGA